MTTITTQDIKEMSYPSTCQLCSNGYMNSVWHTAMFCPQCKSKMMALMDTLSNQPKLDYDPDPWDKLPEQENPFNGLNQMAASVYQGNADKGFWEKERNVGETLMLVVTELAEAMEAHRKGNTAPPTLNMPEVSKENFEMFFKDTFEDEIADAVIRILDLCGGWNIDLEWHVREKVKYNASRERLHGKQY